MFNALTGLRAKVGNYAGVTVERKEGKLLGAPANSNIQVLDLPGTYSLSPNSLDEQISRDVLLHRLPELPPPDLIVVVVDASNLQRNLYYATQVVELGHPTIIALNMVDVAEANGHHIDEKKLSESLGVPVMPIVASNGTGVPELKREIIATIEKPPEVKPQLFCQLPGLFRIEATALADLLAETFQGTPACRPRRKRCCCSAMKKRWRPARRITPQKIQDAVAAARKRLEAQEIDWRGAPIEWRYARIAEIQQAVTTELAPPGETFSDKLDRVLTHKVWGTLIFIAIMALMFQSIFTFAHYPMDAIAGRGGLARRRGGEADSAGRFEFAYRGRGDCGCGRGGGFSAANSAAVFVHRLAGRHGLHGAGGVFDGSADEQSGAARQKFYPDAEFLCVRDSGHHGHAHD